MTRTIDGRLGPADIGWLAAAAGMFTLFIGMMVTLFFGQVAAWADDESPNIGIVNFKFAPTALTVKPGDTVTFENQALRAFVCVILRGEMLEVPRLHRG